MIKTCLKCKKTVDVGIKPEDYERWAAGELLQNAAPYLTADDREILLSGLCGSCFDALWEGDNG